jgi:hypothetical protein
LAAPPTARTSADAIQGRTFQGCHIINALCAMTTYAVMVNVGIFKHATPNIMFLLRIIIAVRYTEKASAERRTLHGIRDAQPSRFDSCIRFVQYA